MLTRHNISMTFDNSSQAGPHKLIQNIALSLLSTNQKTKQERFSGLSLSLKLSLSSIIETLTLAPILKSNTILTWETPIQLPFRLIIGEDSHPSERCFFLEAMNQILIELIL